MKRDRLFLTLLTLLSVITTAAQQFENYFDDATLRLDYIFAGDSANQQIYVDELCRLPRWYGRRSHLSELPLKGAGQLTVTTPEGDTIYRHSFSTLFQEWLATDEAKHTSKSFENVFLMPFPKQRVAVDVELYDYHDNVVASLRHTVDPADILIRRAGEVDVTPYITLQQAADTTRCIHIAFLAEGYQRDELDQYLEKCREAIDALFAHEPFASLRHRFNIIALLTPSRDSGVTEPGNNIWRQTALGSQFDTFYMQRYLTTLHLKQLHDRLAGTPYEHIIILANTGHYGGGGIYNSYNLSYTNGKHFRPVVVHEFGHSFGGLGDEYPYGDNDPMYFADTEPWEPNLTTLHDFTNKWADLIPEGTPCPTPLSDDPATITSRIGLFEGGGYLSKGVYRPVQDCRMRTNEVPEFCPVCQRALTRLIDFYTLEVKSEEVKSEE